MIALSATTSADGNSSQRYELEIIKSERTLRVLHGDTVAKAYRIAAGRGGSGDKQRVGDRKTPVGTYRIVELRTSRKFDQFFQLNYPNVKDAFYGLKNENINRAEFDQILNALKRGNAPPQNTELGGAIGIHGLGRVTNEKLRIHDAVNWTEGCIALTNEQLQDLRKYVAIGTVVVIRE